MPIEAFLDVVKLDVFIRHRGAWVDWFKTRRCPCLDENGYLPPACPVCFSTGWTHDPPVRTRMLVNAHEMKKDNLAGGTLEVGTRNLTPQRFIRLSEGDWVRVRQYPIRDSEVIVHGAPLESRGRLDAMFPINALVIESIRDGALYRFPKAAYTNPATLETIGPDGVPLWQPGMDPYPGESLSVDFYRHDAYRVFHGKMPMQRGTENKRLPDRALGRPFTRRDLLQGLQE